MLTLTYLGHACFVLEAEDYRLLLDPYTPGYVPGLDRPAVSANRVLCSHDHADHCWEGAPVLLNEVPCPFAVSTMEVWHDGRMGALRGRNTIHILEYRGLRLAHLGDLGHDLTEEQIRELGPLDVVMLPVGGTYTLDCGQASALADRLDVRTVIPMHYRRGEMGFPVLQSLQEFLDLRPDWRELPGSTLEVTENMPRITLVLNVKQTCK